MPLCAAPSEITNVICLCLHFTATVLLFGICRVLSRQPRLAFATAALFGIFPFGYGAVVWACGSYIIPCLIFFLAALTILLRHVRCPLGSERVIAVASSLLVFLGCVAGEHLVFASGLVGVLAVASTGRKLCFLDMKRPLVIAPILAVGVYLALVLLTQTEKGVTNIRGEAHSLTTVNPRTLLSVWLYQIRNLDYFQPWLQTESVRLAVQELDWLRLTFAGLSLAGVCLFLRYAQWNNSEIEESVEGNSERIGKVIQRGGSITPVVVIAAMMLGLSAVHALAGGYSASSRHQYAPLALLALLVAATGARFTPVERWLAWRSSLPLVVLVIFGAATTWLVTGLNHFELQRHHALCDFLAKEKIEGSVHLEFVPPLYSHWPRMHRTLGGYSFDDAWVINLALESRGATPISITTNSIGTIVRVTWNGATNAVEVVSR